MNWSQDSKRIKRLVEYHISTRQRTAYSEFTLSYLLQIHRIWEQPKMVEPEMRKYLL